MSVTFRSVDGDDLEALLAFSTDEPVALIGADRYRAESEFGSLPCKLSC
ncbi:MAG: hypothetical protein ACTHMH_12570 [Curtobacterium sp.]